MLARGGVALLCALYVVGWGFIGWLPLNPTDLDAFFLPAARIALDGHPLQVYSLRYGTVYPNANGPLDLLPLTAVAAVLRLLGWLDDPSLRRMLIMAVFAIFPLLMGREALLAVERLRGRSLRPLPRVLFVALLVLSPLLWLGMLGYGHIELAIMIWLLLAGVRQLAAGRTALAGALLGLALLTRSSAVVYLIPLAALLAREGRWRAAAAFLGTAAGTLALGLAPFALADRDDLLYSLVTFHAVLPVGGGSLLGLSVGTPYEPLAQRYDTWAVLGAVALLTAGALALHRGLRVRSAEVYALLALCNCCFALFIKTLWPYYFFEAYVLVCIWWAAQARLAQSRRGWVLFWAGLLLPAALTGLAELADYGVTLQLPSAALPGWSALIAGLGLICMVALALAWAGVARAAGSHQRERAETMLASVPAPPGAV